MTPNGVAASPATADDSPLRRVTRSATRRLAAAATPIPNKSYGTGTPANTRSSTRVSTEPASTPCPSGRRRSAAGANTSANTSTNTSPNTAAYATANASPVHPDPSPSSLARGASSNSTATSTARESTAPAATSVRSNPISTTRSAPIGPQLSPVPSRRPGASGSYTSASECAPIDPPSDSSDIEFIGVSIPGASGPHSSAAGEGSSRRKRPRIPDSDDSDDDEVQFISAGSYLTASTSAVPSRKVRSVLTGTFVQSGPPQVGWGNVELLAVSDDDADAEEEAANAPGPSRRPMRSTRATVSYVEAELDPNEFDDDDIPSAERPRVRHDTAWREREATRERQRQAHDAATKRREEEQRKQKALRARMLADPIYQRRRLDSTLPPWFPPAMLPPLKIARRIEGVKARARFEFYVAAYNHLLDVPLPDTMPPFLRGWVIKTYNRADPVPAILSLAAKFGATTNIVRNASALTVPLPDGALFNGGRALCITKFHEGSLTNGLNVQGQYVQVTALCVLAMIDTMVMTF